MIIKISDCVYGHSANLPPHPWECRLGYCVKMCTGLAEAVS